MSGSQKVLRVFGILELIGGVLGAVGAVSSAFAGVGAAVSWGSVIISFLAGYLLLAASKDASKVGGAWLIVLVDLVLSVLELLFAFNSGKGASTAGAVIAIVLNLIVFIAANNVKKQAGK